MLRLKVTAGREGQHPSEVFVIVKTADGKEEQFIADKRSIKDGTVSVGYPLATDNDRSLVELPREALSGIWRLWVPKDALIREPAAA